MEVEKNADSLFIRECFCRNGQGSKPSGGEGVDVRGDSRNESGIGFSVDALRKDR